VGIVGKQFIIDTARNGVPVRAKWGNWCNIKSAGLGARPAAAPAPLVDAYFWIKPPGESDGVADSTQPRFDPSCTSSDSASGAPQAGQWFESYFRDLIKNAHPAL
jgi:cellulose 1,4-beta-cellobiosidase